MSGWIQGSGIVRVCKREIPTIFTLYLENTLNRAFSSEKYNLNEPSMCTTLFWLSRKNRRLREFKQTSFKHALSMGNLKLSL